MLYNVPVISDDALLALLSRNAPSFFSCYFSLLAARVLDGRYRQPSLDTRHWIGRLSSLNV